MTAETPTTAVHDGQDGLGQVVGTKVIQLAIAKGNATGLGMVTTKNSTHFETAAYYAMMTLDAI